MKHCCTVILMFLIISSCSNKNRNLIEQQKYESLNGKYTGLIPCAGCPGIWFTLNLKENRTYISSAAYQHIPEIPYIDSGRFVFVAADKISLQKEQKGHAFFLIRNDHLEFLDAAGNRIESDFTDLYTLKKIDPEHSSITEELEGKWVLNKILNREISRPNGASPYLMFNVEENKITGNIGCNDIQSTFVTDGDILLFNTVISTRMDCGDPIESAVLEALLGPLRFHIENGNLILQKNAKESLSFKKEI